MFQAGLAAFWLTSAAAALAPGLEVLAAPFAQGCGAMLAVLAVLALLGAVFPEPGERARATAVLGGLAGIGATAGSCWCGSGPGKSSVWRRSWRPHRSSSTR